MRGYNKKKLLNIELFSQCDQWSTKEKGNLYVIIIEGNNVGGVSSYALISG